MNDDAGDQGAERAGWAVLPFLKMPDEGLGETLDVAQVAVDCSGV